MLKEFMFPMTDADGSAAGANGGGDENAGAENSANDDSKTYTKAEVEELLQKEADKRVAQALKRHERKTEKQIREAEKLASMNEDEKYKYQLAQKEQELAEKEKSLLMQENKVEALKIMGEKGVPASLVDFLVTEDADETLSNINLFDKELKKAVQEEVRKRIGSSAPQAGGSVSTEVTRDAFKKMSLADRTALYERDKDLYEKLSKGD